MTVFASVSAKEETAGVRNDHKKKNLKEIMTMLEKMKEIIAEQLSTDAEDVYKRQTWPPSAWCSRAC